MRPDDDDFAAIVIAQAFQLIDGSGNTLATLDDSIATIPGNPPGLEFWHNATEHSALGWNRAPVGNQLTLTLEGPLGDSRLQLHGGSGAGQSGFTLLDFQGVNYIKGGNDTIAGNGVEIQGSDGKVSLRTFANPNSRHVEIEPASNGDLNIKLSGSGRVSLDSRDGYLPLAVQALAMPANVAVGAAIVFLINGINITGEAGDIVMVSIETVSQVTVAGPLVGVSVQAYLAGVPTALANNIDMMGAVGTYVSGHHRTFYTLPSAGTYTFTCTGQAYAGGGSTYLGGYTYMLTEHWGIR